MKFKLFPYHHIRWGGAGQIFARTFYKPINELQSLNAFWRSADAQLILVTRHCYGWLSDISPIILSLIELVSAFTYGHEGWFLIQSPDFYSSSRQTQKVAAQSRFFRYPWVLPLRDSFTSFTIEHGGKAHKRCREIKLWIVACSSSLHRLFSMPSWSFPPNLGMIGWATFDQAKIKSHFNDWSKIWEEWPTS